METKNSRIASTRVIAGAVGGYVWGFTTGLLNGIGFSAAVGLAGYMFLSGALAGLIGHLLFVVLPSGRRVVTVAIFAVIGAVFFGSQGILLPDSVQTMLFQGQPLLGGAAGAIGGATGGVVYQVFQTARPGN